MLTERQRSLYRFLLTRNDFVTQYEAARQTGAYNMGYGTFDYLATKAEFHDCPGRHAMTADIQAINQSDEVDKIIISTPQGIKIATEEEFKQYIDAEFAAIFRKLKRTYAKAKKANLDGQYNFKDQVIEVFN